MIYDPNEEAIQPVTRDYAVYRDEVGQPRCEAYPENIIANCNYCNSDRVEFHKTIGHKVYSAKYRTKQKAVNEVIVDKYLIVKDDIKIPVSKGFKYLG